MHVVQSRFLLFLFFALTCPAFLCSAETVSVNKAFNKKEIKVRVGASIRLELEELGAAGYEWKVQNLDSDYFETIEVQTKDTPPAGDITGAPVTKTWLFRSKKAGKSELKLIHRRPWEDEKNASDTFILSVRIVP